MTSRELPDAPFHLISGLVRARTGLVFAENRRAQAEAGIRAAMAETGIADAETFSELMQDGARPFDLLIEKLTVGETYFFRERDQFEILRRDLLPELVRQRGGEKLRIWSAGCATGEEAYSLAILADQQGFAADIHGSDISRTALATARKATYGKWSFRDNSPDLTDRYFERRGSEFVLIDRIRRMVEFDAVNLASEVYPARVTGASGLDLILCRNVLIYFDGATVERVAQQLFAALREGGWLIAGPSDPPLWTHAPYDIQLTSAGVLYRRVGAKIAARAKITAQPAAPSTPATAPRRAAAVRRHSPAPSAKPAVRHGKQRADKKAEQADCALELHDLVHRGDLQRAAAAASMAADAYPLSPEIQYLQAVVLMSLGRYEQASSSLRRVIYLDRSMAVAHFTLGALLRRSGAFAEARRSFRNVIAVCRHQSQDEIVPLSDGEPAGRMAEAARSQLALIQKGAGAHR